MSYKEEEYLLLSGIQHFVFCRRQWALIHIEQQWEENFRTVDGRIMHKNAHDRSFNEKRGDLLITRGMAVSSSELGISGECDVVEFRLCKDGVPIFGRPGRYSVTPVEYKRGLPKEDESDKLQLAAQAMCLEEMLVCEIPAAYIYYGEKERRLRVAIDSYLRNRVKEVLLEMHEMYRRGYTPKCRRTSKCGACSLKNICVPVLCGNKTASSYMQSFLEEADNEKIT